MAASQTKYLSIVFTGEDKSATKAFRGVDQAAETTGGKLASLGKRISPAMTVAAGAVVAGVGAMLATAFRGAEESAQIARETERVITTTGAAAWTTAGQISDLAKSTSVLIGQDDELVQKTANLLLTFTNVRNELGEGNDVFNQATKLAIDMATVLGTDASSAAIQLGKALNDPIKGITALSRAGVSFTEQQKEQIRTLTESGDLLGAQKIVLEELAREFGGAAESAATPMGKLRVQLSNVSDEIGAALLPAVGKAADAVSFLARTFQGLPDPLKTAVPIISGLILGGAGLVTIFAKLSDSLAPVFSAMRTGFFKLQESIYNAGVAMTGSATKASTLANALTYGVGGALAIATVALIGYSFWQQANAEDAADAAAGQEAYAAAINATTGSLEDNVKATTAKLLGDKNVADALVGTSTDLELFGDALANQSGSFEQFRGMWDDTFDSSSFLGLAESLTDQGSRLDQFVDKLRESAAGGDALATELLRLRDNGELSDEKVKDLALTFDDLQDQYEVSTEKGKAQQAVFEGMAGASKNAATANLEQVNSLKDLANELRAQTDPFFAVLNSQKQNIDAQSKMNEAIIKYGEGSTEARQATIDAARAAVGYKTDLVKLKTEMVENGTTIFDFQTQMEALKEQGFDPTEQSARDLYGSIYGIGIAADKVDGKSATVYVRADITEAQRKLRSLLGSLEPTGEYGSGLGVLARASGGPVAAGRTYLVGENGPELFTPNASGSITNAGDTRRALAASSSTGSSTTYVVNVAAGPTSDLAAIGKATVNAIAAFERRSGDGWRK